MRAGGGRNGLLPAREKGKSGIMTGSASTLDHVSPSQLSMFLRCARQWSYRYIDGLVAPPSISLVVGSAYHDALATNFMQKIQSEQDLPVSDVLDAFSTSWDRQLSRRVVEDDGEQREFEALGTDGEGEAEDTGDAKDGGVKLVRTYHYDMAPTVQPASVEKSLEIKIGDLKLVGRLDLETITGKVIDHKTSARSKSQAEMDLEFQPFAYGLLNRGPVDFDFHVAVKTKKPKIQVIQTPKTTREVIWFLRLAQQVSKAMHTGIYPPNPTGWWCNEKYCGYHSMCKGGMRG